MNLINISAVKLIACVLLLLLARPAHAGIAWIGQDGWLRYSPDDGTTIRTLVSVGTMSHVEFNPVDQLLYVGPSAVPGPVSRVDPAAAAPQLDTAVTLPLGSSLWTIDPFANRLLAIVSGEIRIFSLSTGQMTSSYRILPPGTSSNRLHFGGIAVFSASRLAVVSVQATTTGGLRPVSEKGRQPSPRSNNRTPEHNAAGSGNDFLETGHYLAVIDLGTGIARLALDSEGHRWYRSSGSDDTPAKLVSDSLRTSTVLSLDGSDYVINPMNANVADPGRSAFDDTWYAVHDRAMEALSRRMIGQRTIGTFQGFSPTQTPFYWIAGGVNGSMNRAPFLDNARSVTFAAPGLGVADALTGSSQRYAALGVLDDEGNPTGEQLTYDERVSYLWVGGDERAGLAADGVSTLILRTPVLDRPGIVGWTVEDVTDGENQPFQGPENGLLRDPFDPAQQWIPGQILTPTITPDGGLAYRGVALLKAPLDFVRPDHKAADELRGRESPRKLRVSWTFTPVDGTPPSPPARRTIELHRPPVVLLHGLFDRRDSWAWSLPSSIFDVETGDYRESHGAPLLSNAVKEPRLSIGKALAKMRGRGIAATQADVFGHSMGGLLSRLYAMNTIPASGTQPEAKTGYFRPENLGRGDMHKLVTVSTPHQGSQMSDLVVTLDNQPQTAMSYIGEYFLRAVGEGELIDVCTYWIRENSRPNDITAGAVRDMRPDSPVLARMYSGTSHVPTHAIVGVPQTDTSGNCYAERTRRMLALGCTQIGPFEFFGGPNDGAVAADSQGGGISTSARSLISGDGGLHGPIIDDAALSVQVQTKAIELLNAPITGEAGTSMFTVRLPGSFTPRLHGDCGPIAASAPIWNVGVCTVINPFAWRVCLSALESSALPPVEVTFISSAGQIVTDIAAPFEAEMTAPPAWVGTMAFSAIVTEASGSRSAALEATAWVPPPAGLTSIRFDRPEIGLSAISPTGEAWVRGLFADGIERNLSVPGIAIQYSVDDESVAAVDSNGRVTARRVGSATLTATYGGQSATIPVQVLSAKGDWDRNGAVDLFDSRVFDSLFSGPSGQPGFVKPGGDAREVFDYDNDGDIDCDDWQIMRGALTGPPYVFPLSARCEPGKPVNIETLSRPLPYSYCGQISIRDMSSDGRIAVGYQTDPSSCSAEIQSLVWPLGGQPFAVPQVPSLNCVSADGSIAFSSGNAQSSFIVDLSTLISIPIERGGHGLTQISNDGSVVLSSWSSDYYNGTPSIWRPGLGWIPLPGVPSTWVEVFATGMSANGQRIAGGFYTADYSGGVFVFDLDGGLSVLDLPPEYQGQTWTFDPELVFLSDNGNVLTAMVKNGQTADVVQFTFGVGWTVRFRDAFWLRQVSPSGNTFVIAPNLNSVRLYTPNGVADIEDNLYHSLGIELPSDWWDNSEYTGMQLLISDGASVILGNRPYWATGATRISLAPPPPPACRADFNTNGVVDTPDLVFFLGRFGQTAPLGSPAALADFNSNGAVDTPDLVFFLGRFGQPCP
ncbi:MAG: GC-type dockerin domain-anchored protein [Phycisphaerales bacterium]